MLTLVNYPIGCHNCINKPIQELGQIFPIISDFTNFCFQDFYKRLTRENQKLTYFFFINCCTHLFNSANFNINLGRLIGH